MTTTTLLGSFREVAFPRSYGSLHAGVGKDLKREAFDAIGVSVLAELRRVFGTGGEALVRELKGNPEIYNSGEIYVFPPEIQQSIQQSNTRYMESKNPSPKKT
ncbi:MAG: hypothetical protein PHH70_04665 [Candidatus Gracilibacteria bacterium]|nr:hypothetical protein [Candidatus Gracilibacteria bacterium]